MLRDNSTIFIKRTIYALLIIFSAILQNTSSFFREFLGAGIVLIIPVTIIISMFETEISSMFFGLLGGLLWDIVSPDSHYFHSLFLAIFAFFTSMLIQKIMRNTLLTSYLLVSVTTLLHNTIYWVLFVLLKSSQSAGSIYFSKYVLSYILSSIVGILIYLLIKFLHRSFREY